MTENNKKNAGCVAAGTPEAARAGVEILEEGGNAVDAAVAVSLVLGVSEPAGSGIGGQSTFIVHPEGGEPFVLNGTSFSPQHTPTDAALTDLNGHRASTVPSNLRVLDYAWRKHGSGRLSWQRLVEPAIICALEGYSLGPFRRRALLRHEAGIRKNPVAAGMLLAPDGAVPLEGTRMLNRQFGKTLKRIAGHGAEDFYTGEIAREIARDMSENGGWVTEKDLGRLPEPETTEPIRGTYREFDILTLPPPGAGWAVLLALNILEQAPEGTVVGVTQSLNSYFGAKTAAEKLGFLYNDYMREFVAGMERHPYALRSFAMPYSFMSATIMSFNGHPKLVLGSPGDDRILSAVVQVLSHWVDLDRGIRAAVRAPRLHTLRHDELLIEKRPRDEKTLLALEEAGYTVHLPLSRLFAGSLNPYFGGVNALAMERGGWCGAADPRRDGAVEYVNYRNKSSKDD